MPDTFDPQRAKDLELLYQNNQLPANMRKDYETVRDSVQKRLGAPTPEPPAAPPSTTSELAKAGARGLLDYGGAAAGAAQDLITGRYPRQIAGDIYHAVKGDWENVNLDFWPTNYSEQAAKGYGVEPSENATAGQRAASNIVESVANPTSWSGPGGWVVKTLSAIGSGVGSELLGEAGEAVGGPGLGTAGRIIGGAAGGVIPGSAAKSITHAETRGNVVPPSLGQPRKGGGQPLTGVYKLKDEEQIKASADAGYSWLRNPKNVVQVPPQATERMYRRIITALHDDEADRITAKNTFAFVDKLRPGNVQEIANSKDVLALHNMLGRLTAAGADTMDDPRAAQIVRGILRDELANNLPKGASKKLENAMGDWSHYQMIADVQKSLDSGIARAHVSGTNKNSINTMRQEIRKILFSDKRVQGFPPEARQGMERVISGTFLENFARWVGKMGPQAPLLTIVSALFNSKLGLALAAGQATSAGARTLGDFLTKRQIADIVTILRQETPSNAWRTARNRKFLQAVEPLPRAGALRGAAVGGETEHEPGPDTGAGAALVGDIGNFATGGLYGVAKGRGGGSPTGDAIAQAAHMGDDALIGGTWAGPEVKVLTAAVQAGKTIPEIVRMFPHKSYQAVANMVRRLRLSPQRAPTGRPPGPGGVASRQGYSTGVLDRMQADKAEAARQAAIAERTRQLQRGEGYLPEGEGVGPEDYDVSDVLESAPEAE